MHVNRKGLSRVVVTVALLCSHISSFAQVQATFAVKMLLRTRRIHVGDALVIDMTTTNMADHEVLISPFTLEALNSRGQDLGDQVAGVGAADKGDKHASVLRSGSATRIQPQHTTQIRLTLHPTYDALPPGVYRLRLYRRDRRSHIAV